MWFAAASAPFFVPYPPSVYRGRGSMETGHAASPFEATGRIVLASVHGARSSRLFGLDPRVRNERASASAVTLAANALSARKLGASKASERTGLRAARW